MNPPSVVEAGNFLFFSGIRGREADGTYANDTRAQARTAFRTLDGLLRERGLTLAHVVKVTTFMGELLYRDLIHDVWVETWPENPPARLAFEIPDAGESPGDGAHFVLDVTALAKPELLAGRRTVNGPEGGRRHMAGMVNAVEGGGMIFFSSIRGRNAETKTFTDDVRVQARECFEQLTSILEHEGLTLGHIVKVTMFSNDVAYRDPFHEVWMQYFPHDPPARTALGVVNASASPRGAPLFVLDVTALAGR